VGLRSDEKRRIEAWVEKRKLKSATVDDAPRYFGEIAQVEFNAWQYNESNLVASLVEHLFRNLRILPNDGDRELDERRETVMKQVKALNTGITTLDETIEAAKQSVETAKGNVVQ